MAKKRKSTKVEAPQKDKTISGSQQSCDRQISSLKDKYIVIVKGIYNSGSPRVTYKLHLTTK